MLSVRGWRALRLGVFRAAELLPSLRPLHRQHQLHPRGRVQPAGRAADPAAAVLLLALLPAEQDTARRASG